MSKKIKKIKKIKKPRYFGRYNPGDTVPKRIFDMACQTRSGYAGNDGYSNDAYFFNLKCKENK